MLVESSLCSSRLGGVERVELCGVGEIVFGDYDPVAGVFRSAEMVPSARLLNVPFADNGARYTEHLSAEGDVEHRLEFTLALFSPESVSQLIALSRRGIVAIVTLTSEERLVVGYSPLGGGDSPLRLLEAETDSSWQRSQLPTTRLLLGCIDGWVATPIEG